MSYPKEVEGKNLINDVLKISKRFNYFDSSIFLVWVVKSHS